MEVKYKGEHGVVGKKEFYCKAGAYEHKWRTGWVLVQKGQIVLGGRIDKGDIMGGANRYEYPEYRTRKELLAEIRGME